MKAQVPYLAGLARQSAGQATLRPPRRLFAGGDGPPAHSASHAGPAPRRAGDVAAPSFPHDLPLAEHRGQHSASPLTAAPDGAGTGADPAAGTGLRAGPGEAGVFGRAGVPGVPELPRPVLATLSSRTMSESSQGTGAPSATTAAAYPGGTLLVELPRAIEPAAVTGEIGTAVSLNAPDGGDGPGQRQQPTAIRDLLPPPALVSGPGAPQTSDRGAPRQRARATRQASVSIGTIEVTVVPPARPALPAPETRPQARTGSGRSRPPSSLAASVSAGRLRDGLRRWYGTGQG